MVTIGVGIILIIVTNKQPVAGDRFYYLAHTDTSAEIRTRTTENAKEKTVFTQNNIADFVVAGHNLFVTIQTADSAGELLRVDTTNGTSRRVDLPRGFAIQDMRISPDKRQLAFTLVSKDVDAPITTELFFYDISTEKVTPVLDDTGTPVQAFDLQFAPDSKTLQVNTPDGDVIIVHSDKPGIIMSLGNFPAIFGFSHDQSRVIVADAEKGTQTITLATQTSALFAPELHNNDAFMVMARPLGRAPGYIVLSQVSEQSQLMQYVEYITDTDKVAVVFTHNENEGEISDIALSPNDRYVAIDISNADPAITSTVRTEIVDAQTSKNVASVSGSHVRWP